MLKKRKAKSPSTLSADPEPTGTHKKPGQDSSPEKDDEVEALQKAATETVKLLETLDADDLALEDTEPGADPYDSSARLN